MSNELRTFALRTTLNEIKNVCPDLSHSLIFDKDAKILVADEGTSQESAVQFAYTLNALIEKAEIIGGLESTSLQTSGGNLNLVLTPSFRIAAVTNPGSEDKYVTDLHRVLVPTVLDLLEKIVPDSQGTVSSPESFTDTEETSTTENTTEETIDETTEEIEQTDESSVEENNESRVDEKYTPSIEENIPIEDELGTETSYPEPAATQFMIENVGGLLVSSDTVQIDNAAILQWNEMYENVDITEVEIETLSGHATRCRFKPIKDARHSGKGVVRIPKKVQLILQACEGELVTVKPVLE